MKILVFSDSHRDVDAMADVAKKVAPDMVLHLGDHIMDAVELKRRFSHIPMEFIKGNCDIESAAPSEKIIEADGLKIFITHGDKYGVRNGTSKILKKGRARGADIILFGHTHHPVVKSKHGCVLMNPGRIGRRAHGLSFPSFGIIETGKKPLCNTYDYDFVMRNPI